MASRYLRSSSSCSAIALSAKWGAIPIATACVFNETRSWFTAAERSVNPFICLSKSSRSWPRIRRSFHSWTCFLKSSWERRARSLVASIWVCNRIVPASWSFSRAMAYHAYPDATKSSAFMNASNAARRVRIETFAKITVSSLWTRARTIGKREHAAYRLDGRCRSATRDFRTRTRVLGLESQFRGGNHRLDAVGGVERLQDGGHVILDRPFGHAQLAADDLVGLAGDEQFEDLGLPRREAEDLHARAAFAAIRHSPRLRGPRRAHDLPGNVASAGKDEAQGIEDHRLRGGLRNEAQRAALERFAHDAGIVITRHHDDGEPGIALLDVDQRREARHVRQVEVEKRQVEIGMGGGDLECARVVVRLEHLYRACSVAELLQDGAQALADELVVVDYEDFHGAEVSAAGAETAAAFAAVRSRHTLPRSARSRAGRSGL